MKELGLLSVSNKLNGLCNNEIYYWSSFYGGQGASARPASGGRVISAKQSELLEGRAPPLFRKCSRKTRAAQGAKGRAAARPLAGAAGLSPAEVALRCPENVGYSRGNDPRSPYPVLRDGPLNASDSAWHVGVLTFTAICQHESFPPIYVLI